MNGRLYRAIRWVCLRFARWYFIGRSVTVVDMNYPGTIQDRRHILDVTADGPTLLATIGRRVSDAYQNQHIESSKVPLTTLTYDALWRTYVWTK